MTITGNEFYQLTTIKLRDSQSASYQRNQSLIETVTNITVQSLGYRLTIDRRKTLMTRSRVIDVPSAGLYQTSHT